MGEMFVDINYIMFHLDLWQLISNALYQCIELMKWYYLLKSPQMKSLIAS